MGRFFAVIAALILGVILFLLMGKAGGNKVNPDGKNSDGPKVVARAKIFRIPIQDNPPSLDPAKIEDVLSDSIARKMYNMLLRAGPGLMPAPDLAEAMPVWDAKDNSYTFQLQKGVTFQNGRELKAEDVKYSFNRLLDPKVSIRTQNVERVVGAQDVIKGKTKEATGIEVLGDYTIKIKLEGPSPTFLHEISTVNCAIIPKEAVEAAEKAGKTFSQMPVGTGPFKMVEWKENSKLELTAYRNYFKGTPRLEGILYEILPDPQARLDRFFKNEFDVCDIPFGKLRAMRAAHPELISENPVFRTQYLGLTMKKVDVNGQPVSAGPIGENVKIRQAINHAIDRAYLCKEVLEDRGTPAYSILPPGMLAHNPDLKGWSFDPAKSKALLAEAGFPDGKGLPAFTLLIKNDPDSKRIAPVLQQDLDKIGIKLEIQSLDWAAFLDKVKKSPPDLFTLGWIADYNDSDNFLFFLFHTANIGSSNEARYSDPEVDAWLNEARSIVEQPKREELYRKAETKIMNDCPWCVLYQPKNVILLQKNVKNVRGKLTSLDVGTGMSQLEFAEVDLGD